MIFSLHGRSVFFSCGRQLPFLLSDGHRPFMFLQSLGRCIVSIVVRPVHLSSIRSFGDTMAFILRRVASSFQSGITLSQQRFASTELGASRLPRQLFRLFGYNEQKADIVRYAPRIFEGIRQQASRDEFYDVLGVSKAFEQRFQLHVIHLWMLVSRLRNEGRMGKVYLQAVTEILWDDTWRRLVADGVPGYKLDKTMDTLRKAYYGTLVSLDEGHLTDDMRLAGALFRYFPLSLALF